MAHAFVWTEINSNDLTSELKREIPFAGFGTIVADSWNKRIFKLKWQNVSVENIRIWLDDQYPDIYLSEFYSTYKKQRKLSIVDDFGFDIRVTPLDTYNIIYLPNAKAATNLHVPTVSFGGTNFIRIPLYVDGAKIEYKDNILVKNQNSYSDNGLYRINSANIGTGLTFFYAEEKITAARIIAVGNTSYYSFMEGYKPNQFALIGTTEIKWVDRTNTYKLEDVVASGTSNLQISGSALTSDSILLDNVTLELNDRVLIKEQTDARQNGIYYVSDLYADNQNRIINPNTSNSTKDNYWQEALYNIYNDIPVSVQVLFGSTTAGKYYRYYKSEFENIIPYLILPGDDGGSGGVTDPDDSLPGTNPGDNSGLGGTTPSDWTDSTHYYQDDKTTWYYDAGCGETLQYDSTVYPQGQFINAPTNITDYLGNFTLTAVGQSILVNHCQPEYRGIYEIIYVDPTPGFGSTWRRRADFDVPAEYNPRKVFVDNNRSEIGSPVFYISPLINYDQNQPNDSIGLNISPRFIWWTYEPVANLITKEISNFNRVNQVLFDDQAIDLTQRVLVTGQATTASQNGIYTVGSSGLAATFGLIYNTDYWIKNGSIANSSGSNDTFFLYSDQDNVSFGAAGVTFVNITSIASTSVDFIITQDKISTGYISPDDFGSDVNNGDRIFLYQGVQSSNAGVYTAIVSPAQKAVFNFSNGLKNWFIDIYRNVLNNYKDGSFTISPNLRKQVDGPFVARNIGGFAETSLASRKYGNIYAPEIEFPLNENSAKFFDTDYLGSSIIQEMPVNWNKQDYQSYVVKGIYFRNNLTFFPNTSATAISSKLLDGTIIQDNEDVLVYIGNNSSTANTFNGIWRAKSINGTGSSVYFVKHEDFDFSTEYLDGTNVKSKASPYERPTKVIIQHGYFASAPAAAFAYTTVYMQGKIGFRFDANSLGALAITSNDDQQYNAGQDIFIKNSFIELSRDYSGIGTFPKMSPIQHFIIGDLKNKDTVDGDIIILNRGSKLFTTDNITNVKYYYELGDRVIYQDENEDLYLSTVPNFTNGIYQIVHINEATWTYYLRKVKQNSSYGHLDHYKRLTVHANNTIEDNTFSLINYGGNGSTYYFSENNYNNIEIFTINSVGIRTDYVKNVDYTLYSNLGYITRISSFGASTSEFYCYIKQDQTVPNYNEPGKSLRNNFYKIENVLIDKERLTSGIAITSTTYNVNNIYFQITNPTGSSNTTFIKYNKDKNHWYKTLDSNKVYVDELKHVVSAGDTNDYFITSRLSQDGYYTKTGTAFTANFYDTNLFDPATGKTTGIFTGNFYIEKINILNSGLAVSYWYENLSLSSNDNILILSNNSSSIANSFQTSFYNDNNVLIKHKLSGKNDQKILSFEKLSYFPVTLSYDSVMTDPLTPIEVHVGLSTYYLNYNPADNAIDSSSKRFYEYSLIDTFDCNVSTNSNIADLNDLGTQINSYSLNENDLILVKNQNNSFENGVYTVVKNSLYSLSRSTGFNTYTDLKSLGRTQYKKDYYELILPSTTPYTIGSTSGNTKIIWRKVGYGQTIYAAVATLTNFSGSALSYSFSDSYDNYTLNEDDKVLLLEQTDETERYVGRFNKKIQPTFTRVTSSIATSSGFAITNCYVLDVNKNEYWELYYNPDQRTIGVGTIHWFKQNYLPNYISGAFASTNNVSIGNTPSFPNQVPGDIVLLKNQTDLKQNGIYYIDKKTYYHLIRHENLNSSEEIISNYKINVIAGFNNTGFYGLYYNETGTPLLGSTSIYWAKVSENNSLPSCGVATTENINLSSPPSKIDGIDLFNDLRILVKNQTNKAENGIYIVKDKDNKTLQRSDDLNESIDVQPQLTLSIEQGENSTGNIYRIKLPTPRTITNNQSTEYILGTDNIEWEQVEALGLYEKNPLSWQKIGFGATEALYLGPADMDKFYISKSPRFAIAIKAPTEGKFASIGISESGKVRNLKFKVEYNIKED